MLASYTAIKFSFHQFATKIHRFLFYSFCFFHLFSVWSLPCLQTNPILNVHLPRVFFYLFNFYLILCMYSFFFVFVFFFLILPFQIQVYFTSLVTNKIIILFNIFLFDINFDKSTIGLHFYLIYLCLQNFQSIKNQ